MGRNGCYFILIRSRKSEVMIGYDHNEEIREKLFFKYIPHGRGTSDRSTCETKTKKFKSKIFRDGEHGTVETRGGKLLNRYNQEEN
jgi:hypothetical protein